MYLRLPAWSENTGQIPPSTAHEYVRKCGIFVALMTSNDSTKLTNFRANLLLHVTPDYFTAYVVLNMMMT
jgi:hypothetical protein